MELRGIVTTTVLILALIAISTTTAAALSCDCGDICVNTTGWWNDGGAFNASTTPIQAAVNAASGGDTICVAAGSYSENVDITTSHLTLAGEGAGVVTVTAANSNDHVFYVTADYVNISEFTATGATGSLKKGINLYSADHCNISDNTVSGNNYGIVLHYSNNNTLTRNAVNWNTYRGINLVSSSSNTIINNTASNNTYGIGLQSSSSGNTIANNTASNNNNGIYPHSSSNNTFRDNTASNNNYGISLTSSSNNTLTGNAVNWNAYRGINLISSSSNTIANNTASNNTYGIGLQSSSSGNTIANNTASNNNRGIYPHSSSNNTFTDNTADSNNEWDLYIIGSDSTFTNNTLKGTTVSFIYGGDVSLKGVGSPAADPAGQQTIGKFISATSQSTGAWLLLNFSYSDADVGGLDESNLVVWKHNGTAWLEDGWNGTRYLDTAGNVVGVNITSFSVFAPAALDPTYIPPDPVNLANTTGGGYLDYWVNYAWSAGTGNETDSYNVNLNGAWTNGTEATFTNVSVSPCEWANITVLAYNASGTGTLSEGSVSDEVQAPCDTTPPVITIATPVPYGLYTVGTELNFTATDSESGVDTIAGNLTNSSEVSQNVDSGFTPAVGVYELIVTATDNAGNTNVSDPVFFVVYDPNGGHATGGGWFYPDDDSTLPDGKANFGFTAKYKDGSSTGKLNFQYKDAGIHLKSTSIDWLTISSVSAQFQGTGTINGDGLYTFRVKAKDNGEPGVDTDHFDIKIWDGTDTEADPIHKAKNTIAGGNIQVLTN